MHWSLLAIYKSSEVIKTKEITMITRKKEIEKNDFDQPIPNIPGPFPESKGIRSIFQKRAKTGQKKGKKERNIWKFGQKCIKFENILK